MYSYYICALIVFASLPVLDIDECTLGTHNCGPEFHCTNTAGSFRCHPKTKCADGFIQDAVGSCIGEFGVTRQLKKGKSKIPVGPGRP